MRKIAVFLVLSAAFTVWANDAFISTTVGMVLTTATINATGGVHSHSRTTVREVINSGDTVTVLALFENLDRDKRLLDGDTSLVRTNIVNGALEVDVSRFFGSPDNEEEGASRSSVRVDGDMIRIPSNLAVGDKLEDARITLTFITGMGNPTRRMAVTNHEVLSFGPVTVPAGTFDAYKLTRTVTHTTIMGRSRVERILTWYARGIGVIQTENYDNRGRLQGRSQLVELKR